MGSIIDTPELSDTGMGTEYYKIPTANDAQIGRNTHGYGGQPQATGSWPKSLDRLISTPIEHIIDNMRHGETFYMKGPHPGQEATFKIVNMALSKGIHVRCETPVEKKDDVCSTYNPNCIVLENGILTGLMSRNEATFLWKTLQGLGWRRVRKLT